MSGHKGEDSVPLLEGDPDENLEDGDLSSQNQPVQGQGHIQGQHGHMQHPFQGQIQGQQGMVHQQQPVSTMVYGVPESIVQVAPRPVIVPGCPPGLEYLTQIDQLVIKQQVELMEVFIGFETNNKYKIFNTMGQQVYFAAEDTGCCMRYCCGLRRGFTIHISDNLGEEVIQLNREFKCCAGCKCCANADCCAYEVTVEAPPGTLIGYVRQERSWWKPKYTIRDANHDTVFVVEGPCCVCSTPCAGDVEFNIMTESGCTPVGKIAKHWSGFLAEYFTDADNFSVSFPQDLDVRMKATTLACLFLVDLMYFERSKNNRRDGLVNSVM